MAGFGQPSRGANMADQRTSCRPSVQLNIIFLPKTINTVLN